MPVSGKLGVVLTGSILYVGPLAELVELDELDDGVVLTGSISYVGPLAELVELDEVFVVVVDLP